MASPGPGLVRTSAQPNGRGNSLCRRPGARGTPVVEAVRSYVICCVQRTGSWLLAHTLADTGYAGRPSDYFDQAERETRTREWGLPTDDLTAYVRAMPNAATTPNGVLGSKMMWNDFDRLRSSLRPPAATDAGLEYMRATFPHAQYVWLRRADKVRQGISCLRSCLRRPRTGQTRSRERSPGVSPPPAARCRRPSPRSLPQAGRQPDRALRGPRPLSNEFPTTAAPLRS